MPAKLQNVGNKSTPDRTVLSKPRSPQKTKMIFGLPWDRLSASAWQVTEKLKELIIILATNSNFKS
jgi:hypothetical protein